MTEACCPGLRDSDWRLHTRSAEMILSCWNSVSQCRSASFMVLQPQSEETKKLEEAKQKMIAEKMQELQDMDKVVAGLNRQLAELSESIYNKRKSLELMRKDRMETKELLRDKLERLNKEMKETRAQVVTLNFQKKLYREAQERQEQWEEDAKQMLQEKEQELNTIGCRKTLNFDKLSELSSAILEMQQVVIEDREEQERLRQQEELAKTAAKVQAWWRGCMVRRNLGAYGKKEEPKKGKKKKKGKK
ncbi:dynein regulatory complex protein 9 isoform X2 [Takifugu flavidus]|uniref:dynein regulatory complex protein 9 isoform X2 n=1 Tax=Takifugu flavidus TaxID=433684 RepID=UPI0025449545|nr:dynein regulatory complex protein 9 isoform X2 [Takifugu flavidus]